jgi:predicted N-acyltransferase
MDTLRGFSFSVFSSVHELSEFQWNNHIPDSNVLMKHDYLAMIEKSQLGKMQFRYILVKQNDTTIGCIYFQIVQFEGLQLINYFPEGNSFLLRQLKTFTASILKRLNPQMLVSGNIFMTGENGFYFSNSIDKATRAKLLRKAINTVLQQSPAIKAMLISDLYEPKSEFDSLFKPCGYNEITVESDMSITLPEGWNTFDDYLNALSSKYRVRAKKVLNLCHENGVTGKELNYAEITANEDRLFELYNKVMANAEFKLGSLSKDYFRLQKEQLPNNYRLFGYYHQGALIGFISAFVNGGKMEVHYTGMDHEVCRPLHLYQHMMYDMVKLGIENRVTRLHFGRTAPEIKSTIGAVPALMYGYLKHRNPLFNFLVAKPYTARLKPKQYTFRSPFK